MRYNFKKSIKKRLKPRSKLPIGFKEDPSAQEEREGQNRVLKQGKNEGSVDG